jgi:hypothetical protein
LCLAPQSDQIREADDLGANEALLNVAVDGSRRLQAVAPGELTGPVLFAADGQKLM